MAERPPSRITPRDTGDILRDVARDLDVLRVEINERLGRGADAFTRLDERVKQIAELAEEANSATIPKPIPWTRVIPILVTLTVLSITVVTSMERKIDRQEVQNEIGALQTKITALDIAVRELRASSESNQSVLDLLKLTLLREQQGRKK